MPVACAPTSRGTIPPSTTTSTAARRRMLVSLARFGVGVRQGTHPDGHRSVFESHEKPRPVHGVDGPGEDGTLRRCSEPHATREDERLATTDFPASLRERREVRTLELECGPAEQVQSRLGGGDTGAARRTGGCVRDVQAAAPSGGKAGSRWNAASVSSSTGYCLGMRTQLSPRARVY